jgi:hypothetical protein
MKEKWKVWESFPKGEKHMRYLTVLFLTAALAGIASADILDTYVSSTAVPETKDMLYDAYGWGDHIPAGTLIENDLMFDCDSDWLSAVLVISPSAPGMIYQWDADTTPPGAMFPMAADPVYPTKDYDTYVSDGLGGAPSTGAAVDFGYSSVLWDSDDVALTFYTTASEIGLLNLAQVTLSVQAQGTWSFVATASPEGGPKVEMLDMMIVDGYLTDTPIPEPATMGLLLLGGLGVLVRRKR